MSMAATPLASKLLPRKNKFSCRDSGDDHRSRQSDEKRSAYRRKRGRLVQGGHARSVLNSTVADVDQPASEVIRVLSDPVWVATSGEDARTEVSTPSTWLSRNAHAVPSTDSRVG